MPEKERSGVPPNSESHGSVGTRARAGGTSTNEARSGRRVEWARMTRVCRSVSRGRQEVGT